MESSFEKLMRIGESIALVHADPGKRKAEEMEEPEERCLDRYFDGRAKGIGSKDLESHCVEILNNPGLYCCLNQWFDDRSSKFEDPITLEEIHYDETGYFVESENEENQIEKIPVQVAITYPGLHRWKLESLEEQIRRRDWKDQFNSPFDFYMVINSAKRTQKDSGTGLPSVTNNQDSRGTYTFNGTLKHRKGYTIEGQFVNLHEEGGRAVFDSKKCKETTRRGVYEGEWKRGIANGVGTYTYANGDFYKGQFLNGNFNGEGTLTFADGEIYKGQWLNGKKHGKGTFTFPEGGGYTGDLKNGDFNGEGTYTYPNGAFYQGRWMNDEMHGVGTFTYADGGVYKGQWLHDKRHGKGTLEFPDGGNYKGQWLNGKKHGKGTLTFRDGRCYGYTGDFKNDSLNGEGTYTYPDGGFYQGQWMNYGRNGEGTAMYPDGGVYKGQWLKDKRHGDGTMEYADGGVYRGQWL